MKTKIPDWVKTAKSAMVPIDFFTLFETEQITFFHFREVIGMTAQGAEIMLKRGTMKKSLYNKLLQQNKLNIESYVIKKGKIK